MNNVVLSLVNEFQQNGVDPNAFEKPDGFLFSFGSSVSDTAPPRAGDSDYIEWHGRRDWPKVTSSAEDMYAVIQEHQIPGVHDEPARQDRPPQFSPRLAAQIALTARLLGAGATFHSISGLRSQPFTPFEQDCARAFFAHLE